MAYWITPLRTFLTKKSGLYAGGKRRIHPQLVTVVFCWVTGRASGDKVVIDQNLVATLRLGIIESPYHTVRSVGSFSDCDICGRMGHDNEVGGCKNGTGRLVAEQRPHWCFWDWPRDF